MYIIHTSGVCDWSWASSAVMIAAKYSLALGVACCCPCCPCCPLRSAIISSMAVRMMRCCRRAGSVLPHRKAWKMSPPSWAETMALFGAGSSLARASKPVFPMVVWYGERRLSDRRWIAWMDGGSPAGPVKLMDWIENSDTERLAKSANSEIRLSQGGTPLSRRCRSREHPKRYPSHPIPASATALRGRRVVGKRSHEQQKEADDEQRLLPGCGFNAPIAKSRVRLAIPFARTPDRHAAVDASRTSMHSR